MVAIEGEHFFGAFLRVRTFFFSQSTTRRGIITDQQPTNYPDQEENLELFKQAINEGLARKFEKDIAACEKPIEPSDRHKRWMNNFFRNKLGCIDVPYPEIDDD